MNRNGGGGGNMAVRRHNLDDEIDIDDDDELEEDAAIVNQHLIIERKASVTSLLWLGLQFAIAFTKKAPRNERQWSRSFAPHYLNGSYVSTQQQQQLQQQQQHHQQQQSHVNDLSQSNELDYGGQDAYDGGVAMPNLQESELFFDSTNTNSPQPSVAAPIGLHRGTRISSQLLDGETYTYTFDCFNKQLEHN